MDSHGGAPPRLAKAATLAYCMTVTTPPARIVEPIQPPRDQPTTVHHVLQRVVEASRALDQGAPADYIPELAHADCELTSAAITRCDGTTITAGDAATHRFTLQSSAKLVVLLGLLEERGPDAVFEVVGREPSLGGFASLANLDRARPANPLINAGAIALCGQLQGPLEQRLAWLEGWVRRCYGEALHVNQRVLASERRTGDRNRAIAYLLRQTGVFADRVDEVLETYFALCSFEATVVEASRLPALLAAGGVRPSGERILSRTTAGATVSLMATCGMYDESGAYLLEAGLPAKSGVSGVIVAVAPGRAGIAVASPRLNHKGGSVRGHYVLRRLSSELGWHFAHAGEPPQPEPPGADA
ncbi:MAG: glutaminase A [Nannocystaceae bacterium]